LLAAGLPDLVVAGLDAAEASDLLKTVAERQLPPDVVERLVDATGGNPLAMLELARADPHVSAHHDLPVETSVERAYLRRADGLSPGARQVLLLMAASGISDPGLAERAARSVGASEPEIDEAERATGLVHVRAGRIEFVHPLARAAVYHSASQAQRRAAHRALANAMSDPDLADRRAWHLAAAATGWDAEAATELEQAARRARDSSAYDSAALALAESARLTQGVDLRGRADRPAQGDSDPERRRALGLRRRTSDRQARRGEQSGRPDRS